MNPQCHCKCRDGGQWQQILRKRRKWQPLLCSTYLQRASVALINHKLFFSCRYFQGMCQGPAFPLKWLPAGQWPERFFALCLSRRWGTFGSQAGKSVGLWAVGCSWPPPRGAAVERAGLGRRGGFGRTRRLPPEEHAPRRMDLSLRESGATFWTQGWAFLPESFLQRSPLLLPPHHRPCVLGQVI